MPSAIPTLQLTNSTTKPSRKSGERKTAGEDFSMESVSHQSLAQQVRRNLASIKPLRNAWHFAIALCGERHWRTYSQSQYAAYIATHPDPWGYSSSASALTEQKFQVATEMLSEIGRNFERALEIGCAQGGMTERLAPLCKELLAVDYVPVAIERAQARCRGIAVSFAQWDLQADPVPGQFDLIVITDVLGSFGGRRDVRRASYKLVAALTPGGYLLYGDVIGDSLTRRIQNSWPGRLLLFRPSKILRIFAAHPALVQVTRRNTEMHVLALLQKRAAYG
jgi:2-polyprenyl-3-methyl-5-hydroxy-6-metoxy-1,4-benzoquinol methylase